MCTERTHMPYGYCTYLPYERHRSKCEQLRREEREVHTDGIASTPEAGGNVRRDFEKRRKKASSSSSSSSSSSNLQDVLLPAALSASLSLCLSVCLSVSLSLSHTHTHTHLEFPALLPPAPAAGAAPGPPSAIGGGEEKDEPPAPAPPRCSSTAFAKSVALRPANSSSSPRSLQSAACFW